MFFNFVSSLNGRGFVSLARFHFPIHTNFRHPYQLQTSIPTQNCHPERSQGSAVAFAPAVAFAFLSVIPSGESAFALRPLLSQQNWVPHVSSLRHGMANSTEHRSSSR
jgi:hypothetical protein